MTVNYHHGHFPPKDIDWSQLIPLIGPANAAIIVCGRKTMVSECNYVD